MWVSFIPVAKVPGVDAAIHHAWTGRWMTHREDNPWYPTIRIFRQNVHMAWGPVFERMTNELRAFVPGRVRTPSVAVAISPGELIDKITILEIKSERISDTEKLGHVMAGVGGLTEARDRSIFSGGGIWRPWSLSRSRSTSRSGGTEDDIRTCVRERAIWPPLHQTVAFGVRDQRRRAAIKRRINERLPRDRGREVVPNDARFDGKRRAIDGH